MTSIINSRVAKNIKAARMMRNYSQEYIAGKLHISQKTYSKNELGYCPLKIDRLLIIAEILEVNAIDLISGRQ